MAIPGVTYTSLEMASPHARKAQALTFPKDLPAASVTDTFLEILLHTGHVQVRGCAKASGDELPMTVNELCHSSHYTRNRPVKH